MKVFIPTTLQSYTSGNACVEAAGATLDEVTRDLDRQFPGFRFRVIDEQERIRPHVKVFVNREQQSDLSARLAPTDDVAIVQAFSGG
jgi:molybdopterin synthase sulfur carrier subunit